MSASNQRYGTASAMEAEMTKKGAATQARKCFPLPCDGDSATSVTFLNAEAATPTVGNTDESRIHVCYLDEDVTQAAWHLVPNVATLKMMLGQQDQCSVMLPSPTSLSDHFTTPPLPPSARMPAATSTPHTLSSEPTIEKVYGASALPAILVSPNSSLSSGARPAWISIKTANEEELEEILESLPVHVLTRRRIIALLCTNTDEGDLPEPGGSDAGSDTEDAASSPDTREEKDDRCRRHRALRDNFLEYFPAHGYAVLCLQAMGLEGVEKTGRGTDQRDGMSIHGTQLPCIPVVALAFESTLFTFSAGRFGGEGDVRLLMAHQAWPTGSLTCTGGASVLAFRSAASMTASHASSVDAHQGEKVVKTGTHDAPLEVWGRQLDKAPRDDVSDVAKEGANAETSRVSHDTSTGREVVPEPLAYPVAAVVDPPSSLSTQSAREVQQPIMLSDSSSKPPSLNYFADTAISVVCSSLVTAIVAYFQKCTRTLLIEADQLDELVLQILPSRVDQDDMLVRTKNLRHLIAFFHIDALQKERVLKELLLPAMRLTPFSRSPQGVESYQRSLSSVQSTVLKLCKGRDIVNRANMTLVCGVSARLLSHCNFMDYMSHVHTQITVVLMPITIIPNLFAMNVRVPFTDAETTTPFFCIVGITLGILVLCIVPIVYKFLMYKAPGALATVE
ncbi:hypothetical protein, conserved [Leishmania tarentolae]|uniref:Divalent cation transporter n=1 Tax=Leishmania tarentolae TaxID=5689 RepID=A0A640KRF4_LEITA|nr:hypothetical protein, conserved [Leishmania tarentolae]